MSTTEHQSAVGATWAGVRDLFFRQRNIEPLADDERLDGRTILVTGGTAGLGRAIAEQLVDRGARVVVTGRRPRDLPELGTDAPLTFAPVDLANLETIALLIARFDALEIKFDRVVQNAGMVAQNSRVTPDGFDEMEQVNFVAAVAFFSALWNTGLIASSDGLPRYVVIGSESHRSAVLSGPDDVGRPRSYGAGGAVAEYGRTKLLVTIFAMTLARKMNGALEVHALCPGAVDSEIAREAPGWSRPLLKVVFMLTFQSPRAAAEPAVYLTSAREVAGTTGSYLHLMRRATPSETALDETFGDAVWNHVFGLIAPRGFVEPTAAG